MLKTLVMTAFKVIWLKKKTRFMDFRAKIINCEKTDNKDRETRDDIRILRYREVKWGLPNLRILSMVVSSL